MIDKNLASLPDPNDFRACLTDEGIELPGYLVNGYGDVWTEGKEIFLKPYEVGGRDGSRYQLVQVQYKPKRHQELVHRLVAKSFISLPPTPKAVVNHKDGDKHNNVVFNLEWTTQLANVQHAWATGLSNHEMYQKNRRTKITPEIVRTIRQSSETANDLSEQYDVSPETIYQVRRRTRWAWVQ